MSWLSSAYRRIVGAFPPARALYRYLYERGLASKRACRKIPVSGIHEIVIEQTDPPLRFHWDCHPKEKMGRFLYWFGLEHWEPETFRIFCQLVRRADFFWDIGAHTGLFSIVALAANPGVEVTAVEPVPMNFSRLERNVRANGWEGRVTLHRAAIADQSRTFDLHVPDKPFTMSASLGSEGFRGKAGGVVTVDAHPVDDLIEGSGGIDLAKIDVENKEHLALRGMTDTLARSRPALILEVNPDGPSEMAEAILKEEGYRFFHLVSEGPEPRDHLVPDPDLRYVNYLCLPEEKLTWLEEEGTDENAANA